MVTKYVLMTIAQTIDIRPLPQADASSGALQTIASTIFVILGAVALLVITIAGFRYTISHGDPGLITQSKNAILYALIGLVVAICGFAIVNFVIGRV